MGNINDLRDYARQLAQIQGFGSMITTIEKELLHYEILDALDAEGILDELVFQGGTSLRLCYGAERYSEDLDFAGGRRFSADDFEQIKNVVEREVGRAYSVTSSVTPPKNGGNMVSSWTVVVDTAPQRKDIPKQRIKIEIASIGAHDPVVMPLQVNYTNLPTSYEDITVRVESRDENMADKIEAFVCSDHVRYRDLWDMLWLRRQYAIDDSKVHRLRMLKADDYGEIEKYASRYSTVESRLDKAFVSQGFAAEMRRFLPQERVNRTVAKKLWVEGARKQLSELFQQYEP